MRKKLIAVALLAMSFTALAQTNVPPAGLGDFGNTLLGYFSSFNTNYDSTFRDNSFDLWTGASSIQGGRAPLVNDIGLSYDVWHPTMAQTNSGTFITLGLEGVVRNSGVAGSLVSGQGGINFGVTVHDTRLEIYGDGGTYATGTAGLFGEVGLRVKKAVGLHFFLGVGAGAQFPRNSQVFSAFGGATF